ncbi:MAG: ImmA/IrrE family metallo-endopeptidase [Acidobacteria bacterium]|nr:ImmA/IrrE family metallo-endopeptidase [Acidobacteriota bacterium]
MLDPSAAHSARDAKLAGLHDQLVDAVEGLVSGDDWRRALEFAARFRSRSFNNTLLIWVQHTAAYTAGRVPEPMPSYVAGFKQWQQLNRSVLKGQTGYMIQAPVTARFATATPQNADTWRRLGRMEKPRPGEVVQSRMIAVKPAYVWDLSQTGGDPVPERPPARLLEGAAPAGLWDGLVTQIQDRGFTIQRVPNEQVIHGANGLTDYTARTVAVRTNMDEAAQVKTLAHELAHVMLHGPDNPDAVAHRGIGEVEAESVALMVGAAHNLDTSGYTIPYVASWASAVDAKTATEVVQATGERVRATAGAILDKLTTAQASTGDPPGLTRETPAIEQTPRAPALRHPRVPTQPHTATAAAPRL